MCDFIAFISNGVQKNSDLATGRFSLSLVLYTIEASVRLKATMAALLEVSIAATASVIMKEEQEWRWMLSPLFSTGFQQEFGFTNACFHC